MSIAMRSVVGLMATAKRIKAFTGSNPIDSYLNKGKPAEMPAQIYDRYGAYFRTINGAEVLRLEADHAVNELIYLHGGGYVLPMTSMHWGIVDRLMGATKSSAVIPRYLLAPEHTAPEAFKLLDDVLERAFTRTKANGGKLILAGDSAGGGLALAYAMDRLRRGLTAPDQLILLSPWLDLTLVNPGIADISDPMLTRGTLQRNGQQWAGDWALDDPRVSPFYGSVENLPKTLIFQGTSDILYPDARDFACRARKAGAPVDIVVAPGGFHVYMALTSLPESRKGYRKISELF